MPLYSDDPQIQDLLETLKDEDHITVKEIAVKDGHTVILGDRTLNDVTEHDVIIAIVVSSPRIVAQEPL